MKSIITFNQYGIKEWRNEKGEFHREDGPAIEYANEYANGDKYWYLNGLIHREDGPAVEYADGSKSWFINGKCHRENGPAVEWTNGNKYYYLNDEEYTEAEFLLLSPP